MFKILIIFNLCIFLYISATHIPSLYEYFTSEGIETGLSDSNTYFTLNNKNITIFSGTLHYFRVPKLDWRDRLRKYRAAGLIAIETYVPWNLHEFQNGRFDFGAGKSEFEEFLNIVDFLKLVKEEDLFVILRPGPFIDSEWEFGGLPSWLLRYKDIKVRTSDSVFIEFVERYFKKLLELIRPLQFTKGGPIIAVQIENEYGNIDDGIHPVDINYLQILKHILRKYGIVELLFTSDSPTNGFSGTIPGVLATANFQTEPVKELLLLKKFQPKKPLMVMEYWTGWFDYWFGKHNTRSAKEFGNVLEKILDFNASVNFYMFNGGTSWGFMNGAVLSNKSVVEIDNKGLQPLVTTHDYDAPISEAGDYRDKYFKAKELISKYNTLKINQPPVPKLRPRMKYPEIEVIGELSLQDIINQSLHITIDNVLSMEMLPINNNSGQSYGYIVYRKSNMYIPSNSILKIEGRVCDTAMVLINGILKNKILESKDDLNNFGFWKKKDSFLGLGSESYNNVTLDVVVENWGRVNYGFLQQMNQYKGLWQGNVTINKEIVYFDKVIPLEFKRNWTKKLVDWKNPSFGTGPKLYKAILDIDNPIDTYIDMRDWNKGIIIVNSFVLARYLKLGPQLSSYFPAAFMRKGKNEILIFEHFAPFKTIKFTENLIFKDQ